MGSLIFSQILQEMQKIHDKKKKTADYASDSSPMSNFNRALELVSWFNKPADQVFACMIAIKLARLAELSDGREAQNESIRDTRLDLCNYCVLWMAYHEKEE